MYSPGLKFSISFLSSRDLLAITKELTSAGLHYAYSEKATTGALFTCSDLTFVNKIHNGGVTKAPNMNYENVN